MTEQATERIMSAAPEALAGEISNAGWLSDRAIKIAKADGGIYIIMAPRWGTLHVCEPRGSSRKAVRLSRLDGVHVHSVDIHRNCLVMCIPYQFRRWFGGSGQRNRLMEISASELDTEWNRPVAVYRCEPPTGEKWIDTWLIERAIPAITERGGMQKERSGRRIVVRA